MLNFQQRFSTERASASKFKPIEMHNNKRKFLKIGHYTIVAARIPTMLTLIWHTKHIVKATLSCFSFISFIFLSLRRIVVG